MSATFTITSMTENPWGTVYLYGHTALGASARCTFDLSTVRHRQFAQLVHETTERGGTILLEAFGSLNKVDYVKLIHDTRSFIFSPDSFYSWV